MKLKDYSIDQRDNIITLHGTKGGLIRARITENTGKIVYRVTHLSRDPHPGLEIGADVDDPNVQYILHNHQKNKCAEIDVASVYADREIIHRFYKPCSFDRMEVLKGGLNSAIRCEPYKWFDFNCQTFINEFCEGRRYSESVNKYKNAFSNALVVAVIIVAVGAFIGLVSIAFKNSA